MTVRLRLTDTLPSDVDQSPIGRDFDKIFETRKREADEFYAEIIPAELSPDAKAIMRQSLGGMLWSKQFYHYVVRDWLAGDPSQPPPPPRAGEWGATTSGRSSTTPT